MSYIHEALWGGGGKLAAAIVIYSLAALSGGAAVALLASGYRTRIILELHQCSVWMSDNRFHARVQKIRFHRCAVWLKQKHLV